jgi:hypothetical protein
MAIAMVLSAAAYADRSATGQGNAQGGSNATTSDNTTASYDSLSAGNGGSSASTKNVTAGSGNTKEPLNKVEFGGSVVLNVDFADMRFQNSD